MSNWHGFPLGATEDPYRRGYRDGWKDAMEALGKQVNTPVPAPGCQVCGIIFNGAMGYCCPRTDCPTAVRAQ